MGKVNLINETQGVNSIPIVTPEKNNTCFIVI